MPLQGVPVLPQNKIYSKHRPLHGGVNQIFANAV